MRIRTLSLIVPILVLVAACASTASSPSAAAPSVAAPSVAPSASVAPSEPPASVAPSEPPASVDPNAAFRDETMQPLLDEITTALTRWGEAATAAAAPDAPDTAKIAVAGAAFRVRVALESATATLGAAVAGEDMPECAAPARDEAVTFLGELTSSSEDLLADDSASPDDVQAVIQQATDGLPALTEAVTTACG